jgi:hypothetical protein
MFQIHLHRSKVLSVIFRKNKKHFKIIFNKVITISFFLMVILFLSFITNIEKADL